MRFARMGAWLAAAALMVAIAFVIGRKETAPPVGRTMIAVLPFGDDLGLTEEIIGHLGAVQTERLGVTGVDSAIQIHSRGVAWEQAARELHVRYIVDGSVQRSNGEMSVTAALRDARDGSTVWSDTLRGTEANEYRFEGESAAHITTAVLSKLFPQGVLRTGLFHIPDRGAWIAYREGRAAERNGKFEEARTAYERAVAQDGRYEEAWSALADVEVKLAREGNRPTESFANAMEAAENALQLNSSSAMAHTALADARFWSEWNAPDAEAHFRIALRTSPSYVRAHREYAWFLAADGRMEAARTAMARALELDPLSVETNLDAARLEIEAHLFEDASRHARKALELAPGMTFAQACLSVAETYARAHSAGPAGGADPYLLALHYALSGDLVRAMRELEHASESGSAMVAFAAGDPAFRALRSEPAFQAMIRK